jgi:hypothetical protein
MKIIALAVAGIFLAGLLSPAWGNQDRFPCTSEALPAAIQSQLKTDFASWKVQETKDLSSSARKRWESMKVRNCPGIAMGEFETANRAYAVLLVPVDHPDAAYRFVVFSGEEGQPFHKLVVEEWNGAGAANYFIRKVQIASFFSDAWKRKLHVASKEGILLADAGTTEYETDVYYWADQAYHHEPVDY